MSFSCLNNFFNITYNADQKSAGSAVHAAGELTQQLLGYTGGEGGTGKSQVIKAIQFLFKLCKTDHWLRSASYTGTAANNINGTTLSSLLKDNQKQKEDQLTVSFEKMEGLRISLGSIKFMIIDEVSMLSTQWLAKLDARCKQARGGKFSELPFGGIHIICFGDFVQYPPVGGTPLYQLICTSKKATKTSKLNHVLGRALWLQFDYVKFLVQQMRQDDERFYKIVNDLRNSSATDIQSNYDILCKRIPGPHADPDATFANYSDAPVITTRNAVREAINLAKTKCAALEKNEKQLIILANDKYATGSKPSYDQRVKVLHMSDKHTEKLPGMLPLISGMPLVVKHNLATELGVCNGTLCTLATIVFPAGSEPDNTQSTTAEEHFLTKQPSYLIVNVPNPKFKPFPGLLPGQFPLFPISKTFVAKVGDSSYKVKRTQFPCQAAFALTGYTAQGGTFPKAILDLSSPNGNHSINHADIYVLLSRLKKLSGLLILRPFNIEVLATTPVGPLQAEITRLGRVSEPKP